MFDRYCPACTKDAYDTKLSVLYLFPGFSFANTVFRSDKK